MTGLFSHFKNVFTNLFLVLSLASCQSCTFYPGHQYVILDVDPVILEWGGGFGRMATMQGSHYWDSVGAHFRLPDDLTPEDEANIASWGGVQHLPIRWRSTDPTYAGWYHTDGTITLILEDFNEDSILTTMNTVAHELGHSMELNHVPDPEAVMYFETRPRSAINHTDVDEFHRVWGYF